MRFHYPEACAYYQIGIKIIKGGKESCIQILY